MNYKDQIKRIVSMYEVPYIFTNESLTDFISVQGSLQYCWGFCARNVSDKDLSTVSNEVLFNIPFNSETVYGPTNFPYAQIFEQMKTPGLSIRELHQKGIDGSGINIAVIDKPILKLHSEFTDCLAEYTLISEKERGNDFHFHGMTCASFACGKTTGTAPGAKLYYYAYPDDFTDDDMYWNYHFKAFKMIIEHNKSQVDKISIVSVSAGVPYTNQAILNKLFAFVDDMAKGGCYLIFSNNFGSTFTCSSRVYGADIDDSNSYKLGMWQNNQWHRDRVLIPSGGRTGACNSGYNEFIYWGNNSCNSWAIPYLCGVFALAMQINSDITYQRFCELVIESAILNSQGLKVLNPTGIIDSLLDKL